MSALKDVDDAHGAAALRTDERAVVAGLNVIALFCIAAMVHRLQACWRIFVAQQIAGVCQIVFSPGVGDQTVVADAVEPRREHMKQEAADELLGGQCHGLVPVRRFGPVVFPSEGDSALVQCDKTTVRDGDPVSVAGQVGQDGSRSGKRAFGVNDPFTLP